MFVVVTSVEMFDSNKSVRTVALVGSANDDRLYPPYYSVLFVCVVCYYSLSVCRCVV